MTITVEEFINKMEKRIAEYLEDRDLTPMNALVMMTFMYRDLMIYLGSSEVKPVEILDAITCDDRSFSEKQRTIEDFRRHVNLADSLYEILMKCIEAEKQKQ